MPQLVDELVELEEGGGSLGTARAADDHERGLDPAAQQARQGLHRDVGALERLDAPDEEQQRPVGGQRQGPASLDVVAGGEEGVVDARRHDGDAGGIGAVELDQLVELDAARGEHGV